MNYGKQYYPGAKAVTKSDTVDDPAGPFQGFYVSVAGDVAMIAEDGTTVTLVGVLIGRWYPIGFKRVLTATSATIVGLRNPGQG